MKIDRIEIRIVALPPRREHPTATRQSGLGRYVLTRILADGIEGWGEATVLKEWGGDYGHYFGEEPSATAHLLQEVFAPALIGLDPTDIGAAMDRLDRAAKGYPYAKASLDIALHDLIGHAIGVPVYQLLGGRYRDRIPVAHSLGILEERALLEEVAAAVDEGCRTIKLKAGLDPVRDVRTVAQVRGLVGPDVDITVDANQGWPEVKIAIGVINAFAPHRVLFVEQPVEGLRRLAQVAQAVPVAIMADESAWNAFDVLEIARLRAADAISVYTTKPGGLQRAMKMGAVAEAAGLPCNVNGSHETGIGNAANLHLAAALRPVTHACVLPVNRPAGTEPSKMVGWMYLDDVVAEPFDYEDGYLRVPTGAGLGVQVDMLKVQQYQQGPTLKVTESA
jgi:muconate cycloisomerase